MSKKVTCGQEALHYSLNCWPPGKSWVQSSQSETEYMQEPLEILLLPPKTPLQKTSGVRGLILLACFGCEFLDLITNSITFHSFLSLFSLFITCIFWLHPLPLLGACKLIVHTTLISHAPSYKDLTVSSV